MGLWTASSGQPINPLVSGLEEDKEIVEDVHESFGSKRFYNLGLKTNQN
jgi:hypothetical protein